MKNLNKWKWQYRCVQRAVTYYDSGYYRVYPWGCDGEPEYRYREERYSVYYKWVNKSYYRHPKTMNELKQYNKRYCRASRRLLPNAWDDILIQEYKSWKHTTKRSHQWKNTKHSKIRLEMLKGGEITYELSLDW